MDVIDYSDYYYDPKLCVQMYMSYKHQWANNQIHVIILACKNKIK
jgi:hypothetical protein